MSDITERDAFDGETLDLVVPSTLSGIRIDRVLSMLTGLSRSEAVQAVANGTVSINDKVVTKASLPLETGQHLVAQLAPRATGVVARILGRGRRRS